LNLEKTFELVGPAYGTEKEELFKEADLLVLPTMSENFGMVVPEALARGVPVITTKGAPWEILLETRCGWWVELGVEPLAMAIREATALTDEERLRMGRRGRALVQRDYSWGIIAEKMLTTYRWLLGRADRPAWVRVD
jgi:glycosyltransferase involved in cell wall biosynthesis